MISGALVFSGTAGTTSSSVTGSATGRQRVFAVVQIAASFVLLAGASMLLKTLMTLQTAQTGMDTRHVLAVNVPVMEYGKSQDQVRESRQRGQRVLAAIESGFSG